MSKLTIIGDPHAKLSNLVLINELFNKIEDLGNNCIILGDLLDTKSIVRSQCLNAYINYFKNSKLNFTILVGNHDLHEVTSIEHSLEPLKLLPNVNIIDKPHHEPNGVGYLSYIHDEKKLKEAIKSMNKDGVKTLFGHLELKGFDFGNGYLCETGMETKSFSKFKRVISGHFHCFQEKGNLTYLGTPFSHSYGESNQEKYIGIYETETDKLDLIPTTFPAHKTIELKKDTNLKELQESKDYIRIIQTNPDLKIDKSQYPKIKFIERFNVKKQKQTFIVEDTDSNDVKFQKWGKSIKKLKANTLKLGLEILRSV